MKVFEKTRIAEIKGVRLNYDHIEQILEWFVQEDLKVVISTPGIDGSFKNYDSIDSLIKARGKKPSSIVLIGKKLDQTIHVHISVQYCIIETMNRKGGELEFKIIRLMKLSVPLLFKLFPFKWFAIILCLMFFGAIAVYFLFDKNFVFLCTYTMFPLMAFVLAGLYNNNVRGINLEYSHEKSSFWSRKKDDIVLLILSTLIITPIGLAIWEYLLKPYIQSKR